VSSSRLEEMPTRLPQNKKKKKKSIASVIQEDVIYNKTNEHATNEHVTIVDSCRTGEENMYWDEIAAMCVDGESLRLSKELLCDARSQQHDLMRNRISHSVNDKEIQQAKDKTKMMSRRVAMLKRRY
jgi:hypothetical protein